MKIMCDIDKTLPKTTRLAAEDRAAAKLDRFADVVEEVRLMVKDLNGPRGGIDSECIISVRLRNMPEVIIHERAESIGKAIFNAVDRAAQNVARNISRKTRLLQRRIPKAVDPAFA